MLEADLKQNKILMIGQLARMDSSQVRALRGVKPDKEVTVKNALQASWTLVKKEEGVVRMRAPVEEETTQEEEEEIKAALFAWPSPSPTDMGDIDDADRDDEEMKVKIEVKENAIMIDEGEVPKTIGEETKTLDVIEEESRLKSPRKSRKKSPVKGEVWSLKIEDTPAKNVSDGADVVSGMEVSETVPSVSPSNLTPDIPSLTSHEAQSTTTPVQSISPEAESVKGEPVFDLKNMDMLMAAELDLTILSNKDLALMYSNLGQHRSKVDQLRDKVAKTMFSRRDIS